MKVADGYRASLPINDFIPYADVQDLFKEGDEVVITEKIRSNSIYICRDEVGHISVSSKRLSKLGLLLPQYRPETFMDKFKRWCMGGDRPLNYFWQAAFASGLIGSLNYWPKIGNKIEVFGSLVPSLAPDFPYSAVPASPSVLVERVSFDGKDQGYHSFFPNWTPLFHYGKWDPESHLPLALGKEEVSGKKLHNREGIVVRHSRLRYLKDNRPLIAVIYPKDVEAWAAKETA